MAIQTRYERYQQKAWPGQIARPNEPHAYDPGEIYVPGGGTAPQPGFPVLYDRTRAAWRLPATAAEFDLQVSGIISYDPGVVVQASAGGVAFADGDWIKVGQLGTFHIVAGETLAFGDLLRWDAANGWRVRAAPTISAVSGIISTLGTAPYVQATADTALAALLSGLETVLQGMRGFTVRCASPGTVAAQGIAEARIGYGRAF